MSILMCGASPLASTVPPEPIAPTPSDQYGLDQSGKQFRPGPGLARRFKGCLAGQYLAQQLLASGRILLKAPQQGGQRRRVSRRIGSGIVLAQQAQVARNVTGQHGHARHDGLRHHMRPAF